MTISDPNAAARQAMRAAIATLRTAHGQAAAALAQVNEIDDTQAALDLATDLAEALAEVTEWMYRLRRRLVGQIWRSEDLSLAQLAGRARISKGRADQLVREFRKEQP